MKTLKLATAFACTLVAGNAAAAPRGGNLWFASPVVHGQMATRQTITFETPFEDPNPGHSREWVAGINSTDSSWQLLEILEINEPGDCGNTASGVYQMTVAQLTPNGAGGFAISGCPPVVTLPLSTSIPALGTVTVNGSATVNWYNSTVENVTLSLAGVNVPGLSVSARFTVPLKDSLAQVATQYWADADGTCPLPSGLDFNGDVRETAIQASTLTYLHTPGFHTTRGSVSVNPGTVVGGSNGDSDACGLASNYVPSQDGTAEADFSP